MLCSGIGQIPEITDGDAPHHHRAVTLWGATEFYRVFNITMVTNATLDHIPLPVVPFLLATFCMIFIIADSEHLQTSLTRTPRFRSYYLLFRHPANLLTFTVPVAILLVSCTASGSSRRANSLPCGQRHQLSADHDAHHGVYRLPASVGGQ